MADLFISYAREDRDTAQSLAQAIEQAGLSVWWDREIAGGSDFTRVIAENLAAARLVLVLWSEASVQSTFVRDESARALAAGKLLPVRIEAVELPLGFGQTHTLDLLDWSGEAQDPALQALLTEVRHLLDGGPRVPLPPIVRRWRWRPLAWVALALLAVGGGYGAWQWQRMGSAERYFQAGLSAQFAREPNLESARNQYLSALELRSRHARTHYYLGHVYAQMQFLADALASFQFAVDLAHGLDASQLRDARSQLAALALPAEPEPVARPSPGQAPRPVESRPGPAAAPALPPPAPGAVRPPRALLSASASPLFALPPAAGAVRLGDLPHLPPGQEAVQRIEALLAGMFAPAQDTRVAATTSLIVDLERISDAVPLALQAAITAQQAHHAVDAERAAAHSGVINTLVLLRAASPMTLRKHAANIRHLLQLARSNGPQTAALANEVAGRLASSLDQRPVAWIQIADPAQTKLAERLAQRWRQAGYDVPGIENVGAKAPARRSELRIHGNSDQGLARWQVLLMSTVPGLEPDTRVLRKAKPKVDSFEIWFDRELCVTRQLPVCN